MPSWITKLPWTGDSFLPSILAGSRREMQRDESMRNSTTQGRFSKMEKSQGKDLGEEEL